MKLPERLTRLSDQVLDIGKEIGRIPMTLDSWWNQYGGAKYWADGFTRKDFVKDIQPKWEANYKRTLEYINEFDKKLETLNLTAQDLKDEEQGHSVLKDIRADLKRFGLLIKANEKQFHDFINPHTTKDDLVKQRFNKSSSVDDWEEFSKKYQEYKGGDLPPKLKQELQAIEQAIDLDLAEIKSIVKEHLSQPHIAQAIAHIDKAMFGLKNEYPRYHAILTQLKAAESSLSTLKTDPKLHHDTKESLDKESSDLEAQITDLNAKFKAKTIGQREYNTEVRHVKDLINLLLNKRSILLKEHIKFLSSAVAKAEDIIKKEAAHWDSLPKKLYKDRPRYIDFHSGLNKEICEKFDDWWSELVVISNGIKGASTKLSHEVTKLQKKAPSGPLDLKQLEKMKPSSQFHEKLKEYAIQVLNGDKSDLDQWVETQVAKLNELIKPKSRLLSDTEVMGVVEMPVLIVKGFISQDVHTTLRNNHFELDRAVGNYQVIKNALLLGVSAKDVKDAGIEKLGIAYREIISKAQDAALKARLLKLHPVGPTIRKGGHIYAILIPNVIVDGFSVEKWGFYFHGTQAKALELALETGHEST